MGKIKVLVAVRPRMLSQLVKHTVARQPDMDVVRELIDPAELLRTLRSTDVEVVIATAGDADREPGLGSTLLAAYPHLKIMTLSETGATAMFYESGSPKKRIEEVGEESMLDAIRELMR